MAYDALILCTKSLVATLCSQFVIFALRSASTSPDCARSRLPLLSYDGKYLRWQVRSCPITRMKKDLHRHYDQPDGTYPPSVEDKGPSRSRFDFFSVPSLPTLHHRSRNNQPRSPPATLNHAALTFMHLPNSRDLPGW
jgi:hypothetical protein